MNFKTLKLVDGGGRQRGTALHFADRGSVAKSRLLIVTRLAISSALLLLATAPWVHAQAPSPSSNIFPDDREVGPDVTSYVSSGLEPVEQEFMRGVVNQLPPSTKAKILQNDPTHVSISVYDSTTGLMHYNRPELVGNLRLEPYKPLPGDDYPRANEAGTDEEARPTPNRVTSCGASPAPGCGSGAGPYRRIFTPRVAAEVNCPSGVPRPCGAGTGTNEGYYVSGTVTTACKAGSFTKGSVGFVFLGGYSPTPTELGGAVDAGLQYNYEDDPSLPNLDKYEMFIGLLNEPKLIYSSNTPRGGGGGEINCGGKTTMELRIAPWELNLSTTGKGCVAAKGIGNPWELKACGTVVFILEQGTGGIGAETNSSYIIWIAPSISYGGWGKLATSPQGKTTYYWPQTPCGGCIFKWTTGIGQKQENLTDGSRYSATWSKRGIARWATDPGDVYDPTNGNPVPMTTKLALCTEYPLWRQIYDGTTAKEDCSNTPKNITGNPGDVKVADYTVDGELDSITLTEKGLPSVTRNVDDQPRGSTEGH